MNQPIKVIPEEITRSEKWTQKVIEIKRKWENPKTKPSDVQNKKVSRTEPWKYIPIVSVGPTNIDIPISVNRKDGTSVILPAVAAVKSGLPRNIKGTNMSRYAECLMEFKNQGFDGKNMKEFLRRVIEKTESYDAYAELKFKYFMDKTSPVMNKMAPIAYDCALLGLEKISLNQKKNVTFLHQLRVSVLVTALCPCSKEISKYGAHNQRGTVVATVTFAKGQTIWIEDLVRLLESCGSCDLYTILKRPDENFVTEWAYENPSFVEDLSRLASYKIVTTFGDKLVKVKTYAENAESIHPYNVDSTVIREKVNGKWRSKCLGLL